MLHTLHVSFAVIGHDDHQADVVSLFIACGSVAAYRCVALILLC